MDITKFIAERLEHMILSNAPAIARAIAGMIGEKSGAQVFIPMPEMASLRAFGLVYASPKGLAVGPQLIPVHLINCNAWEMDDNYEEAHDTFARIVGELLGRVVIEVDVGGVLVSREE